MGREGLVLFPVRNEESIKSRSSKAQQQSYFKNPKYMERIQHKLDVTHVILSTLISIASNKIF